jgi:hypothetical protein
MGTLLDLADCATAQLLKSLVIQLAAIVVAHAPTRPDRHHKVKLLMNGLVRETPGSLSGSGSETHQHFAPAGASCYYSLLLDPDATISIGLRKRLFLLITGRGE